MGMLKTVLGSVGNATAVLLFLSPAKTFVQIWKKKSTEQFSYMPYVTTLANCLLWVLYGLPIVKGNSLLIITINGFGTGIELLYITMFLLFTNARGRFEVFRGLLIVGLSVGAIAGGVIGGTKVHHKRELIVGIICATLNIAMNAAPLSIMKMVIQTKSVEYMPFLLSLFVFLNSLVWLFYAIVTKDIFVMIPNAIGLLLGMLQLFLYTIYKKQSKLTTKDAKARDFESGSFDRKFVAKTSYSHPSKVEVPQGREEMSDFEHENIGAARK